MMKLMIVFFVMTIFMEGNEGIDWGININIGSGRSYQRPDNKNQDDYASYKDLGELAEEINRNRTKEVHDKLEQKSLQDKIMQGLSVAGIVVGAGFAL